MEVLPLAIVQWLHIVAGAVWMSGSVICALVIYPMMVERPKADARAMFDRMAKPMTLLVSASGNLTPLLGILRATVMGPIKSFSQLWESSYGITLSVAFAISVLLAVKGARTSRKIPAWLAGEGAIPKDVASRIIRDSWISVIGFIVVLGCMVLMRFGL